MKIQTTITEARKVEKEITLPYFCKESKGNKLHKVVDEKTMITVHLISDSSKMIFSSLTQYSLKEIGNSIECSESEFNMAANEALAFIGQYVPVPVI
jgi:hypothetical protein